MENLIPPKKINSRVAAGGTIVSRVIVEVYKEECVMIDDRLEGFYDVEVLSEYCFNNFWLVWSTV